MNYVYIQSEPGLWTVGFYEPSGKWIAESDHDIKEYAARRVAWLNGGGAGWAPDTRPELRKKIREDIVAIGSIYPTAFGRCEENDEAVCRLAARVVDTMQKHITGG